jgi:hypothetical protein
VFRRNVIIGGTAGRYPSDNFFPAAPKDAGLTFRRTTTSVSHSFGRMRAPRPDGRDPGVDLDAMAKALDGLDAGGLHPRARAQAGIGDMPLLDWRPRAGAFFWVSLVLLVYVYAGYPLIAVVRARLSSQAATQGADRADRVHCGHRPQ